VRYLFRKHQRVVNRAEIRLAIEGGRCAADGVLVLFALQTAPDDGPRLGVTVPKKMGNAVVRNRWKRYIREAFRTQQTELPAGYDYVIRPKKGAQPVWAAIQRSLPRLAHRATR
jgi:ribonuclease P protein component